MRLTTATALVVLLAVVATPIAENIRSLEFTYFEDTAGLQELRDNQVPPAPAPNVGGVGQYNPATPNALIDGRLIRGKIRSIGLRLVGMNSTEDPYWTDATDSVAPNFRKYELSSVVVPRNLGMFGVRETDAKPPDPPKSCLSANSPMVLVLTARHPEPERSGIRVAANLAGRSRGASAFSGCRICSEESGGVRNWRSSAAVPPFSSMAPAHIIPVV